MAIVQSVLGVIAWCMLSATLSTLIAGVSLRQ